MALQKVVQELKNYLTDSMQGVHTALPGKIVSFNAKACEADVLPSGKFKKPDGTFIDFPKIPGVPVYFPQGAGQGAVIAFPVMDGDECLLVFTEQALDTWRTGAESNTDLRFDLTNAVALVGLFSKACPLVKEACDSGSIIVESGGERIQIKGGEINIRCSGNVNLTAGGSVNLKAPAVNLN